MPLSAMLSKQKNAEIVRNGISAFFILMHRPASLRVARQSAEVH